MIYAAATVGLIQLIQAIFGEVLRSDTFSLGGKVTEVVGGAGGAAGEAEKGRVFLDRFLNDGYESLKRALDINADNVYYFVPALFVLVFLLRSASDFLNGYAFQRIGFGPPPTCETTSTGARSRRAPVSTASTRRASWSAASSTTSACCRRRSRPGWSTSCSSR